MEWFSDSGVGIESIAGGSALLSGESWDEHGQEYHIESDEANPEVDFSKGFVVIFAGEFREPVVESGHTAEYGNGDEGIVEVSDDEVSIMQRDIGGECSEVDTGDAAEHKSDKEAECPEHRGIDLDGAFPEGSDKGEDHSGERDGDEDSKEGKEESGSGVDTGNELMVCPNDHTECGCNNSCPDNFFISEERFSAESGKGFTNKAHCWE